MILLLEELIDIFSFKSKWNKTIVCHHFLKVCVYLTDVSDLKIFARSLQQSYLWYLVDQWLVLSQALKRWDWAESKLWKANWNWVWA